MNKTKAGKCYLVGAGPGDLGLVTLRAKQLIERAEVIVYDYLSNPEMLAVGAGNDGDHLRREKGRRAYPETGGNQCALGRENRRRASRSLGLKGGDPFLFGRGGEEAQALAAAGLPFEVVPGVTSAIAAPAYAGIPVTHRGMTSHVTFFTGHEDPEKTESSIDFEALAKLGGTQVMLMGVERIEAIAQQMMEHGVRARSAGRTRALGNDGAAGNDPRHLAEPSRSRWRRRDLRLRRWRFSAKWLR